jgi:tol-pal system protein YbgF
MKNRNRETASRRSKTFALDKTLKTLYFLSCFSLFGCFFFAALCFPRAGISVMFRFATLLMLGSLLCGGCATSTAPGDDPITTAARRRMDVLENHLAEMFRRLDSLEHTLTDQQQQLATLQAAVSAQKVTPAGENASLSEPVEATGTAVIGASAPETYLKAFGDYASGRYPQAIEGFRSFLQQFPANNYAGNAQYWLGECFYRLGRYDRAVQEYRKVVDNYPLSGKAPDALLHMAPALRQLNQYEQARQVLQTLRQRYPNSAAARKALAGS